MGQDSEPGSVAVPLAPGVHVHCGMSELDGSVEVGIRHEDELVKSHALAPGDAPKPFKLHLGSHQVDVFLGVDHSKGEIKVTGDVKGREDESTDSWKTLVDVDEILFSYNPAHGSIGGDKKPHPPSFSDPRFGETKMSSKNVTRMYVDDRKRWLADVGRHVKKELWDDYPDWVFNTVACVGAFDDAGRGSYSDPTSIWFNLFLGYYQIDAPKPDWTRPFAYAAPNGAASEVRFDEIVRLGKSDWNYFSNWMYGVPPESVARHNAFDMKRVKAEQSDAEAIGTGSWHRVSLAGVDFVSAYEADHPDAERLVHNTILSGLWRKAFGPPNPRPGFHESFVATTLDAEMYVSYWEDDDAFHTVIFGGTAATGADPAFLARQLEEVGQVIAQSYPTLGFRTE